MGFRPMIRRPRQTWLMVLVNRANVDNINEETQTLRASWLEPLDMVALIDTVVRLQMTVNIPWNDQTVRVLCGWGTRSSTPTWTGSVLRRGRVKDRQLLGSHRAHRCRARKFPVRAGRANRCCGRASLGEICGCPYPVRRSPCSDSLARGIQA